MVSIRPQRRTSSAAAVLPSSAGGNSSLGSITCLFSASRSVSVRTSLLGGCWPMLVDPEPGQPSSERDTASPARTSAFPLPNLLTLLFLTLIAANYFGAFADLDFAWQIRTGEQIIAQGTLRPVDVSTYTINGQNVPDFEWLYELILYWTWTAFGFGGLKFLRVLLVSAPLVLLGLRLQRDAIRWRGIALCLFTAMFVLAPAWNLRPMYCTTIGLLLLWGWLHDHCTGRGPLPWYTPLLLLAWSNLHPGVIMGEALLLGAIGWEWINAGLRWNAPLGRPALLRLTLLGGLALIASFIGPDPIERLLYPFKPELADPIMRIFTEMQPLYTFFTRQPLITAVAYVLAALSLLAIVFRFRRYRLWGAAMLLGLSGLANVAIRSLQDWVVLMLAVSTPHVVALLSESARRDRRRPWVWGLLQLDVISKRVFGSAGLRLQPRWLLMGLAALLVVSVVPPWSRAMPIQNAQEWPVAAVDRIEQLGLKGRFFATPDYGSYLTWRLGGRVDRTS